MLHKKQTLLIPLFLSSIVIGVAVLGMQVLFSAPYLGIDFDAHPQGGQITAIDPTGPAGAHPEWVGAIIIAIEDFPIHPNDMVNDVNRVRDSAGYRHWWETRRFLFSKIQRGVPLHLTVLKEGKPVPIQVSPGFTPWFPTLLRAGPFLFSGLLSLLIGLAVMFRKGADDRVRVFFVVTLAGSLVFFPAAVVTVNDKSIAPALFLFLWQILGLSLTLLPTLFLHFALIFPRKAQIANRKGMIPMLYGIALLCFYLYQTRRFFPRCTFLI